MHKENQPILSICIPTNDATQWVIPALQSIYRQNVDTSLFEVVITDNGKESELGEALKQYDYPNLRYIPTEEKGFLNLIKAIKAGNGVYCKMLNNKAIMSEGSIVAMIDIIKQYEKTKPIIYWGDGKVGEKPIIECADVNEFVYNMGIWCTWSAGIGIWKDDIAKLDETAPNELFPHTAVLFDIREKSEYVISNLNFQEALQEEPNKGGYDVFYAFGVEYLNIIHRLQEENRITEETFEPVKAKMFEWLQKLYSAEKLRKTQHTFILQNIPQSIGVYYGRYGYIRLVIGSVYGLNKRRIIRYWNKLFKKA